MWSDWVFVLRCSNGHLNNIDFNYNLCVWSQLCQSNDTNFVSACLLQFWFQYQWCHWCLSSKQCQCSDLCDWIYSFGYLSQCRFLSTASDITDEPIQYQLHRPTVVLSHRSSYSRQCLLWSTESIECSRTVSFRHVPSRTTLHGFLQWWYGRVNSLTKLHLVPCSICLRQWQKAAINLPERRSWSTVSGWRRSILGYIRIDDYRQCQSGWYHWNTVFHRLHRWTDHIHSS